MNINIVLILLRKKSFLDINYLVFKISYWNLDPIKKDTLDVLEPSPYSS